jgi:hypothetical protein
MKQILFVLSMISTVAAAHEHSPIAVPPGHAAAMKALGAGDLAYECKATATAHEWVFAGPTATLYDMDNSPIGKYYGGPTWEANDGSKVTGKQLAVLPAPKPGAIPHQLVQVSSSAGKGTMNGVTFIQRVNTQGGVAPMEACGAGNAGERKMVKYQAEYIFYKEI